jgi:hypothetical protein
MILLEKVDSDDYKTMYRLETHLRSPSTSGRSLVIAMTKANSVTKHVIKATGELQIERYHTALDIMNICLQ